MKRDGVVRAIVLAVLAASLAVVETRGADVADGPPPNVILLMADDHGWDETGYNGHPYVRTPVLDEMAASGFRFDRFYAAAPVCSPTRASVLTGRHPNRSGTFSANWSLRPEEISVAHLLADAGYACGHFGKWHVGPVKADSPTSPGAMGFHEWVSHDNFFEMDPQLSRNGGPPEVFRGESSDVVVEEAIRFIGRAKREGHPFFVVIWFGSPHEPYSGHPQDLAPYDKLPAKYPSPSVTVTCMETGNSIKRPVGEVLRERYAEITAMDRAIGTLRGWLDVTGLRQTTLFWYCSDNGSPPEGRVTMPLRGQKGDLYDGGIRVPAILEWPARVRRPVVSDAIAVTSDFLPTLCQLAGRPLPDRPLDGISLVPLIEERMKERPRPIFFWSFSPGRLLQTNPEPDIPPPLQEGTTPLVKAMDGRFTRNFRNVRYPEIVEQDKVGPRAVVDNRYKLVIDGQRRGGPSREIFDMRADPAEKRNLIDEQPAVARRLERQLDAWQQSVLESLTGADYRKR